MDKFLGKRKHDSVSSDDEEMIIDTKYLNEYAFPDSLLAVFTSQLPQSNKKLFVFGLFSRDGIYLVWWSSYPKYILAYRENWKYPDSLKENCIV